MRCYSPINIENPKYGKLPNQPLRLEVPCGRCFACLERRRSQWTYRLEQEFKVADYAYFITLTYDDDALPITDDYLMTLRKKDTQDFIKRLRQYYARNAILTKPIRYFSVGEYGSKTKRPHYHMILFNCPIDPNILFDLWGHGLIHVGDVTRASIRYVTKYTTKYAYDGDAYNELGIQPPFAHMSTKPAIGSNYLNTAQIKWHKENKALYTRDGSHKVPLPRYYKDKIFSATEKQYILHDLIDIDDYLDEVLERYSNDPNPIERFYLGIQNHATMIKKRLKKMDKL